MLLAKESDAARENLVKNRGTSNEWFVHHPELCPITRQPRLRPEARAFAQKSQTHISTAALAGFAERPVSSPPSDSGLFVKSFDGHSHADGNPTCPRLRTTEAAEIARRSTKQTDRWYDFIGNQNFHPPARPRRIGPGADAKEIVERLSAEHDWFAHEVANQQTTSQTESRHPRSAIGLRKPNEEADWFRHHTSKDSNPVPAMPQRVHAEGAEYALRNRGTSDLLHMAGGQFNLSGARSCPTTESKLNALRSIYGVSMASCLGKPVDKQLDFEAPSRPSTAKVRGSEAREWLVRGRDGSNIFGAREEVLCEPVPVPRVRPEAAEVYKKSTSGSQVSNCLTLTASSRVGMPDDRPTQPKGRCIRTAEAKMAMRRNRGQMDEFLGRLAHSTTKPCVRRHQPRGLRSTDGREHALRSKGQAAKELLTHDRLTPEPPKCRSANMSEDVRQRVEKNRSGLVRNLISRNQLDNVPLTGTEARAPVRLRPDAVEYAVRNRGGEMRGLLRLDK